VDAGAQTAVGRMSRDRQLEMPIFCRFADHSADGTRREAEQVPPCGGSPSHVAALA
jgi:hypothetical protein